MSKTNKKASIDKNKCIGCGACTSVCPVGALYMSDEGKATIDADKCIGCGACASVCPVGAAKLNSK
ncbi:MAG: 4Fe-4S binding protein [Mycoplasmataceae bacterium]|jgi:ferredoxin|nr:4Fe-4S binding protein [Mycoplasmataceae bacterium]